MRRWMWPALAAVLLFAGNLAANWVEGNRPKCRVICGCRCLGMREKTNDLVGDRLRNRLAAALAVQGIAPGKPGDGLAPMGHSMWETVNKSWDEQVQELADVRGAWCKNPLARRIVGLVTAYVVGNGVTVTSEYRPLKRFIAAWWVTKRMDLRLAD